MSKEASWNVFKTKKEVSNSASECAKKQSILWIPIEALTCVLKFSIYILAFLVVLGGSVLSKISMLLMTSQIQPRKISPLCNEGLDRMKKYLVEISTKEQVCHKFNFTNSIVVNYYLMEHQYAKRAKAPSLV